jgi:hypothetical protein
MRSVRHLFVLLATMVLATATVAPAAALGQGQGHGQGQGATVETANVYDQAAEGGGLWAEDGATLRRTPNGIQVKIQMPTPAPDTYTYPEPDGETAAAPGHPEVFTLWAFVFNHPEKCVAGPHECGAADLGLLMDEGENPSGLAVFGVAGHPVGGPNLTLSGGISTSHDPFMPIFAPLTNPDGAEVHLAVAPHGGLDPELMPEQATTPAGTPAMWWTAVFLSPYAEN